MHAAITTVAGLEGRQRRGSSHIESWIKSNNTDKRQMGQAEIRQTEERL